MHKFSYIDLFFILFYFLLINKNYFFWQKIKMIEHKMSGLAPELAYLAKIISYFFFSYLGQWNTSEYPLSIPKFRFLGHA